MTTYTQADLQYRSALEAIGRELPSAYTTAQPVERIDLQGNDITQAVLFRMKSFLNIQHTIKTQLLKEYAAPAANFFVETVLLYLRVAIKRLAPMRTVAAAKNIIRKRGSIRPDISIWQGNQVFAAIWCKTQLGWKRNDWLTEFEQRESRLRAEFPDAKLFLLVMTGRNWPGFGDDQRVGRQFFLLRHDIWPHEFAVESAARLIAHRIESLIATLVENAK